MGPLSTWHACSFLTKAHDPKPKNRKTLRFLDAVGGFKENCQEVKKVVGVVKKLWGLSKS